MKNTEDKKVVLINNKCPIQKKDVDKVDNKWFTENIQLDLVKYLFFSQSFEIENLIKKELSSKLSGYKQQDIKKDRYDNEDFISYDKLLELLLVSKMKCRYCFKNLFILYESQREKLQWTLDRINNDLGHNNDNVIISCLDCNLRRRRLDADKYLFTKQMKLVKLNE